ncbi:MAG: hypothetical protein P8Z73_09930 [Desulfobacteraceae bacterium]|jgi:hypothetical protein
MMQKVLAIILLCLLAGISPVRAAEKPVSEQPERLSPEDLKVVGVLEILQLMDLAEDMEMVKDIEYLIEDDANGSQDD